MKEHLKEYIDSSKTPYVRGLRILLEYFYAHEIFEPILESGIRVVSVFGSARTKPGTTEYKQARELGAMLHKHGYAVVTGASAGIMQAANEGVSDSIIAELMKEGKGKSRGQIIKSDIYKERLHRYSVGLKITLPFEPVNNPFVGVYASFHYFMVRKFFFGSMSSAFIACEGGWGTRDELFEILTLVQTGKAPLLPIIYISLDPDHLLQDIEYTLAKGYISEDDLSLIQVVSDYQQAVRIIDAFYSVVKNISYEKMGCIEVDLNKKLSPARQRGLKELVKKKFAGQMDRIEVSADKFTLVDFKYRSYGILRQIIDSLAE